MSLNHFRVFTLEQANLALPAVARVTEATQEALRQLRTHESDDPEATARAHEATRTIVDRWAEAVLTLGAQPKGVFTVDFRSPDPNVLWCWAPDEPRICHRHFTWESFKDRVSVDARDAAWPSRN